MRRGYFQKILAKQDESPYTCSSDTINTYQLQNSTPDSREIASRGI